MICSDEDFIDELHILDATASSVASDVPAAASDKRPFEDTEENVKRVKKV